VGTFTYERSGTVAGCDLRIAPTTGTLVAPPNAGGILLYTEQEPYRYDGAMSTGEFTVTQVTTCPDIPPQVVVIPAWDIPLFTVSLDQSFDAGPDGNTLRGSYQETSETRDETWEWDLTLD